MFRLAIASSMGLLVGCLMLLAVWFFMAQEANAAPYRQVVDNSTPGRFKAGAGWSNSTYSKQKYGRSYKVARRGPKGLASYKIRTPRTGYYTVCGRWPASRGYNTRTSIQIRSMGAWKIKRVNQQRNGGRWVRLGTYRLGKGDAYKIRVTRRSSRRGYLIADAFNIRKAPNSKGIACTSRPKSGSVKPKPKPKKVSRPSSSQKGDRIVNAGKRYLGTRYYLGGSRDCVPYRKMDCSCLTLTAYKKAVNMSLPDDQRQQWKYGRKVSTPRKGDLLFYDEDGRGGMSVTHVGIYAGKSRNGTRLILHASSYWGKVVVKPMRWPGDGYMGARRLV